MFRFNIISLTVCISTGKALRKIPSLEALYEIDLCSQQGTEQRPFPTIALPTYRREHSLQRSPFVQVWNYVCSLKNLFLTPVAKLSSAGR